MVESDCATVVNSVVDADKNLSNLCHIYREIGRIRKSCFHFVVTLVKRDCNTVAHKLAKLASIDGLSSIWHACVPTQLETFMINDCNHLPDQ